MGGRRRWAESGRSHINFAKDSDDFCDDWIDISFRVPCLHRFSLSHLLSKCTTPSKEEKMFSHFTRFDSYAGFMDTLKFILPNLDRKLLIYWDSTAGKSSVINTEKLFRRKWKWFGVGQGWRWTWNQGNQNKTFSAQASGWGWISNGSDETPNGIVQHRSWRKV